jgi:hypothetical protein
VTTIAVELRDGGVEELELQEGGAGGRSWSYRSWSYRRRGSTLARGDVTDTTGSERLAES